MCLVLTFVFAFLSYSFYSDGNTMGAVVNGIIASGFIILLTRNIIKTKQRKEKEKRDNAR